jgi:hypothetical protein
MAPDMIVLKRLYGFVGLSDDGLLATSDARHARTAPSVILLSGAAPRVGLM